MRAPFVAKKLLAISVEIMLAWVILLSTTGPALAQEDRAAPGRDTPTEALQSPGPADPGELEAFMDDFFAGAMEEYHIAGAAVSVVKDGRIFFASRLPSNT